MTFDGLLFDSRGEIGRKAFWQAHLILFPMEAFAAVLFRVHENALCTQDPATALGKVYYGALGVMALTFLFMWYCVVIKRLRQMGRGHASFFAYAVPILLTLSALAPHVPLSCSVGFSDRLIYLTPIIPFWLIYFYDLGVRTRKTRQSEQSDSQSELTAPPENDRDVPNANGTQEA
ncbi:DUF805 domain-containing protein [uncultured Cohaesibacter sp.]|uniref:DUF805 domain-containing protein n=1 Tax=uncultured Cohaesibacter sp. TaxID=1002546 RepID=UPI00292FD881|nr:DUF805 domain-containing protein [uncultured Cohaesibacter sp.]